MAGCMVGRYLEVVVGPEGRPTVVVPLVGRYPISGRTVGLYVGRPVQGTGVLGVDGDSGFFVVVDSGAVEAVVFVVVVDIVDSIVVDAAISGMTSGPSKKLFPSFGTCISGIMPVPSRKSSGREPDGIGP